MFKVWPSTHTRDRTISMTSKVTEWSVQQLASYLQNRGLSQVAVESIRGNGISGEIFLQLCEDDIKDAFSVFKDRFSIRKILRELKSNTQAPQLPQTTVQNQQSVQNRNSHQRGCHHHQAQIVDLANSTPVRPEYNVQRIDASSSEQRQYPSVQTQSPQRSQVNEIPNSQKRKWPHNHVRHEPYEATNYAGERGLVQSQHFGLSPNSPDKEIKGVNRSTANSFGNSHQLMHETVSSSQDPRIKTSESTHYQQSRNIYPVSLNRVVNNTLESRNIADLSVLSDRTSYSKIHSPNQHASKMEIKTQADDFDHLNHFTQDNGNDTSVSDGSSSFMFGLVTSSISRFSADELLAKKGIRGRPSEAQRLGTVLIRNAAQSVKIWDAPPLMKDISDRDREEFMKYVVTSAPQLAGRADLVWTRLREALQNRRKYLLDKETGRRILKGSMTDKYHRIVSDAVQNLAAGNVKTEPNTSDLVISESYSVDTIDLTD